MDIVGSINRLINRTAWNVFLACPGHSGAPNAAPNLIILNPASGGSGTRTLTDDDDDLHDELGAERLYEM